MNRFTAWLVSRDLQRALKDMNKIGYESIKFGVATFVVNVYFAKPHLNMGALTLIGIGIIIWFITLPKRS